VPDFSYLAVITKTGKKEVARRIEPYDYHRARRLESAGCTVLALDQADLPELRAMGDSGLLTYRQARRLAVLGHTRLDNMPPLVCVVCDEDLENGEAAYGDCVGCGWMVCEACDAGIVPGTGQSVCPAPECRAHPDAVDAEHAP
jgi:hypothetical protein